MLPGDLERQRIRDGGPVHGGQAQLHGLSDPIARELGDGRVHRHGATSAVEGVGGIDVVVGIQRRIVRVRHRQLAAILRDLAREQRVGPAGEVARGGPGVEEAQRHGGPGGLREQIRPGVRGAIGDHDLGDRAAARAHPPGGHAQHLGHERGVLIQAQLAEGRQLPAGHQPAREVLEQLPDRDEAQVLLEGLRRAGPEDLGQRAVQIPAVHGRRWGLRSGCRAPAALPRAHQSRSEVLTRF